MKKKKEKSDNTCNARITPEKKRTATNSRLIDWQTPIA